METSVFQQSKKKSEIRKEFRSKHNISDDKIVLQFTGSTTHQDSLMLIKEAIPILLKDDKIIVSLVSNYQWLLSIGFKPHKNLIISGWVEFKDSYKLPAQADISLVPLPDSKFNRAKSELKIEESAAWQIPCIASDVAPYRRFYELSKGGCVLVRKEKTKYWLNAIHSLIDNPDLRQSIACKARKAIEEVYSLETINKQRLEFWNRLKTQLLSQKSGTSNTTSMKSLEA